MESTITTMEGGVAIVRFEGRLDLLTSAGVKQELAQIVADGHRYLVADLSKVSFIDSSGLGALIGGLKSARLAGGDLRLAHPQQQARSVLEITTLDKVLKVYSTVEEALAGYR